MKKPYHYYTYTKVKINKDEIPYLNILNKITYDWPFDMEELTHWVDEYLPNFKYSSQSIRNDPIRCVPKLFQGVRVAFRWHKYGWPKIWLTVRARMYRDSSETGGIRRYLARPMIGEWPYIDPSDPSTWYVHRPHHDVMVEQIGYVLYDQGHTVYPEAKSIYRAEAEEDHRRWRWDFRTNYIAGEFITGNRYHLNRKMKRGIEFLKVIKRSKLLIIVPFARNIAHLTKNKIYKPYKNLIVTYFHNLIPAFNYLNHSRY